MKSKSNFFRRKSCTSDYFGGIHPLEIKYHDLKLEDNQKLWDRMKKARNLINRTSRIRTKV